MQGIINIGTVLLLPLMGTTLGAMMVFFMRDGIGLKLEKLLLGFAAGVMIAASVWSLLIPSIEMAEKQKITPWIPALIGFLGGVMFLYIIDSVVPHLHLASKKPEGLKTGFSKTTMMLFAVTIHNIPEGMAVGVAYAGAAYGHMGISFASALALSLGIALQNLPEGAIVSMPLRSEGMGKKKAFICGVLSGVVEPVGGLITILLASVITPLLPYLLAFAAGAMIYVVIEELIPEAQSEESYSIGTIGAAVGFALMMVLDVA